MVKRNDGAQNKTTRFTLRLTCEQLETLKAKARLAGMTASEFVVASAIDSNTTFALASVPGSSAEDRTEIKESRTKRSEWRTVKKQMIFKLRMTEDQYERLCKNADQASISKAEYMRRLLEGEPIVVMDRRQIAGLLGELNKQGGNLNQMARKLNALSAIAWRDDVDGSAIDNLVYELAADNQRTRANINDAAISVRDMAIAARERIARAIDGDA